MKAVIFALSSLLLSHAAIADSATEPAIHALQQRWAEIKYATPHEQQEEAIGKLAEQSNAVVAQYPGQAEPLIWDAIIKSTQASINGGLGALKLVEAARDELLTAEKINPNALDGSVYTSLGSLYYKVPGWPIGFGDSRKAREYLEKAVALNPDGIDSNFFYGEFLFEEKQYADAVNALKHAKLAPARPGRELADKGRQEEIDAVLKKAKAKVK